jgi:2-polyprenyl-3-methyl-5-hydroxy-6-metoxy-1,4-benzoquinol methylase
MTSLTDLGTVAYSMSLTREMPSTKPCPLCGSGTREDVAHPEAPLRRCGSCDHCFADLELLDHRETYDESYGDDDHQNWFENPNLELFWRISSVIGDDARSVIDLGCGRAQFLSCLHSHTKVDGDRRLVGVEQTTFVPPDGVEIVHSPFDEWSTTERFDAVVSLAVIEHVDDPVDFLRRASELAEPGGRVVIMTLNDRSLLYLASRVLRRFGITGPFDQLYSRHHLHHFNKSSLLAAFAAVDLEVETRWDHNIPAAAVDFPSQGAIVDGVRLLGVRSLFLLGRLTRRCYLQTVVARVAA